MEATNGLDPRAGIRSSLRDGVAGLLAGLYMGSRTLLRRGLRSAIPILNLHRVSSFRPEHSMTLQPETFRALLAGLQRSYRFVSLRELDRVLASGQSGEALCSLTFDDCYGCLYTHAVPILRALEIPATFFVSSGFVDSATPFPHDVETGFLDLPNFTSAQLRELAHDPLFEIGSHTITHCDFSEPVDPAAIARELAESRSTLAAITGRPVTRFAVPWGDLPRCRPEVIAAARAAGYERVYSHFGGRNLIRADGRVGYLLQRICSHGSAAYVRACLEGYRGRASFLPGTTPRDTWPPELHDTDLRRL